MSFRTLLVLALTALVAAPPLLAAPPDGPGMARHHQGPVFLPPPGYLDLDEAQQEATRAILEQLRADVEPLRTERRMLRQEIRDALDGDAPDALAIGENVIAIDALGEDILARIRDAEAEFVPILDDEQLTKWENFKELRDLQRRHRGPGPDGGDVG